MEREAYLAAMQLAEDARIAAIEEIAAEKAKAITAAVAAAETAQVKAREISMKTIDEAYDVYQKALAAKDKEQVVEEVAVEAEQVAVKKSK